MAVSMIRTERDAEQAVQWQNAAIHRNVSAYRWMRRGDRAEVIEQPSSFTASTKWSG